MTVKLLGNGYPFEVVIVDHKSHETISLFLSSQGAEDLKKQLQNKDTRYVDIAGALYFWSDVKKVEQVRVPAWLDVLIFKTIQKQENRMLVLMEIARLAQQGRHFLDEDQVFIFLSTNPKAIIEKKEK